MIPSSSFLFLVLFAIADKTLGFGIPTARSVSTSSIVLKGYLDNLDLVPPPEEEEEDDSREATNLAADKKDRYGPGDWEGFVDFDEFDGGDGQMGVAGDGDVSLEKFDTTQMASSMGKSKSMSAKNAWGTSSGYADDLVEKQGFDQQRAQQLENWQNQQEVRKARVAQKELTESFDTINTETNQWDLSSFGVGRNNEDVDLDEEFGAVTVGSDIEGTIELSARMGQTAVSEFPLKNQFMGFSDFLAAFSPDSTCAWSVEPKEGALSKEPVNFIIRFKADAPGVTEGYLVIETEDFKKTWKLIGATA